MCYHVKTYRCGHFKRTFTGCRCTLHSSGEQRQPSYCSQWFCDKKPYYSDGNCDRDHISNVNIGHYFNPDTGRRGRFRPGQRLRSFRPARSNHTPATTSSGIFAIPSSRLPTELLDHLAIHPDELDLDHDYSVEYDEEDPPISTGSRILEVGIEIPPNAGPGEYTASVSRDSSGRSGTFSGLSPAEFISILARESGLGLRASTQPITDAIDGLIRMASLDPRQQRSVPDHAPYRATIIRRGPGVAANRPVRINPPTSLRPSRPTRAVVESISNTGTDLMEIDTGTPGTSLTASGGVDTQLIGGGAASTVPQANEGLRADTNATNGMEAD
ncbi:hypothetical protein TWF730_011033 [Orbilia blumenaviensis]|uniref:Uncharacterized protein n=1 Tax=Orbilia blumenaviensis TaxID=1796055 RepID=A0AAV9UK11_9PEZI